MSDIEESNDTFYTIANYSQLWGVSGKVYNLGDWTLPIPIPVSAFIPFLIVLGPSTLVIFLLEQASNIYIWAVVLFVAFAFAYLSDKPGAGGRTMIETIQDQASFLFIKKRVHDLEDGIGGSANSFNSEVFVPQSDPTTIRKTKKG